MQQMQALANGKSVPSGPDCEKVPIPWLLHHGDARLRVRPNWIHDASERSHSVNGLIARGRCSKKRSKKRTHSAVGSHWMPRLVGNTSSRPPRRLGKKPTSHFSPMTIAMAKISASPRSRCQPFYLNILIGSSFTQRSRGEVAPNNGLVLGVTLGAPAWALDDDDELNAPAAYVHFPQEHQLFGHRTRSVIARRKNLLHGKDRLTQKKFHDNLVPLLLRLAFIPWSSGPLRPLLVCKTTRLLRFCHRHCYTFLVEVNRQYYNEQTCPVPSHLATFQQWLLRFC